MSGHTRAKIREPVQSVPVWHKPARIGCLLDPGTEPRPARPGFGVLPRHSPRRGDPAMENQPAFSASASNWLARGPGESGEPDPEVRRLRERLDFFVHFEQIIHDHVPRSSELLKHAATLKESAERELAERR